MDKLENVAIYKRSLWEEANLLVIWGNITKVQEGLRAYNERFGIAQPSAELQSSIRDLLGGAALTALSLADRESWGWTLTLKGSSNGFFIGIEPEGMILCRVHQAEKERGAVLVQRKSKSGPLVESHFESDRINPENIFEHYFDKVEQIQTRIALGDDGEGVLVQALPGGNFEQVERLIRSEFKFLTRDLEARGALKPLGEVLLFYECRCHEGMIQSMVDQLDEDKRDELWGGSNRLEIECPRCGKTYIITREGARA